jgi:hypothetical protein
MEAFTHLSVQLSIILGLAITQLLQGLGQLLQGRDRVRWFWPAALWFGIALLIYVQSWWAMFGLRNVQAWTFGVFAIILLQTILEYLSAALLAPSSFGSADIDLRAHWFQQSRPFFATMVLMLLASLLKELAITGALPRGLNLVFHLWWIAVCSWGFATRREWAHKVIAVASLASIVSYIVLLFTRLQ